MGFNNSSTTCYIQIVSTNSTYCFINIVLHMNYQWSIFLPTALEFSLPHFSTTFLIFFILCVIFQLQNNKNHYIYQWCNLTLAQRFLATKVCWGASKISKICLFGHQTGQVTSWKADFENYYRYSLIKWYQLLSM